MYTHCKTPLTYNTTEQLKKVKTITFRLTISGSLLRSRIKLISFSFLSYSLTTLCSHSLACSLFFVIVYPALFSLSLSFTDELSIF